MKAMLMLSLVALFLVSGIVVSDKKLDITMSVAFLNQSNTNENMLSALLDVELELSRLTVLLEEAFYEVDRIYADSIQITEETDNILRAVLAELEQNSPTAWSGVLPPIQESASRIGALMQRMREKDDLAYCVRGAYLASEDLQYRVSALIAALQGAE